MSTVSVSLPSDGTTADVADYNVPITTIVNDYNGNIDNTNIASGAAIAGSKLASGSVTSTQINFGGSGAGVWWEEIGRTTLGGTADSISVTPIASRKYLRVLASVTGTGAVDLYLRFNNDSAANYSSKLVVDGGAGSGATAQTQIACSTGDSNKNYQLCVDIVNISATEKLATFSNFINTLGAATAPVSVLGMGKWANTSAVISRIDLINANSGDYATGGEIVVLGHN